MPETHDRYNLVLEGGPERNELQKARKVELQSRDVRAYWLAYEEGTKEDALRKPGGLMRLTVELESWLGRRLASDPRNYVLCGSNLMLMERFQNIRLGDADITCRVKSALL